MRFPIALLAMALVSPPLAAEEAAWYFGGSIGQSRAEIDEAGSSASLAAQGLTDNGIRSDESDSGFKLFLGRRVGRNLAVEGSLLFLGEVAAESTITNLTPPRALDFKVKWDHGLSVAGIGIAPISERLSIFGKAGLYYASTTGSQNIDAFPVLSGSESDTNAGFLAGVGLMYEMTQIVAMRGEWERFFDVGGDHTGGEGDFDLLSLGLLFRF